MAARSRQLRAGSAVRLTRSGAVTGVAILAMAAVAVYYLALGDTTAVFETLRGGTGGGGGGRGGGVVFPDALKATKPGQPVIIDSPGDFYARVGGKDSWLMLYHSRAGSSHTYGPVWQRLARTVANAGPCQAGGVATAVKVGAVDCSSSNAKVVCEREGIAGGGAMLPVVRLYADGARDTLAGPSALASGEGSPEAMMAHVRQQHGCATWGHGGPSAALRPPSSAVGATPGSTPVKGTHSPTTPNPPGKTIAAEGGAGARRGAAPMTAADRAAAKSAARDSARQKLGGAAMSPDIATQSPKKYQPGERRVAMLADVVQAACRSVKPENLQSVGGAGTRLTLTAPDLLALSDWATLLSVGLPRSRDDDAMYPQRMRIHDMSATLGRKLTALVALLEPLRDPFGCGGSGCVADADRLSGLLEQAGLFGTEQSACKNFQVSEPSWHYCATRTTAEEAYGCANWLLLHTIAVASDRLDDGPTVGKHQNVAALQPARMRAALRSYVQISRPWSGEEDFKFQKLKEAMDVKSPENEAAGSVGLWLWKLHNGVTQAAEVASGDRMATENGYPNTEDCEVITHDLGASVKACVAGSGAEISVLLDRWYGSL